MVVQSPVTVTNYQIIIKRIRDAVAPGSSGLGFLRDSKAVLAWVDGQTWSVNTRKSVFIACKSTCRDSGDPELKEAESVYEKEMLRYRDLHNEQAAKQELSEREKKLFVKWPTVVRAREKLRVSVSDFQEMQDYVIYCLYTLAPPVRLDYSPMEVVGTLEEAGASKENCLVCDPSGYKFLFRNYKTKSKYGEVVLDVKKPLEEVLREWVELNPSGWLLCDQRGVPLTEKYLGFRIMEVMKKAVGKPIGASMLRHIYISHQRRGEPSYLEQEEMAKAQMHSPRMSVLYRKITD